MAKAKKTLEKPVQTRAEKKDAAKNLIKELLQKGGLKASALIDEAAKEYTKRFQSEDTENPNDVKGRIGSVLDVMKKDGDVAFDGGVYALNAHLAHVEEEKTQENPKEESKKKAVKKTTAKKSVETAKTQEEKAEESKKETQEKPAKKTARKKKEPLPAAPILPNAPVAPTTPENEPAPPADETVKDEKPAVKKRAKKTAKTTEKTQEQPERFEQEQPNNQVQEQPNNQAEELPKEQPVAETVQEQKDEKSEQPKGTLMDVSFLLEKVKGVTDVQAEKMEKLKPLSATEEKSAQKAEQKPQEKTVKPQTEKLRVVSTNKPTRIVTVKKPLTADEKLQAAFLAKLHRLGGDYFEYYSIYLLEKYSRQNGRRLEGLRITSGDRDGGIDGEIELTDRLGFRETIYIQSKNWDPDKGDEKQWVVGETLLQQFIGACACRQAKDGKQHCRGIFITTSRFTPDAKRLLDVMSDKIVGYDGTDLFETAKECQFGLIKKNGEWTLDEQLLSSEKAFFQMR